jgi:hypothetical protein
MAGVLARTINIRLTLLLLLPLLLLPLPLLLLLQVAGGARSVQARCVGVQPAEHHQHRDEQAQTQQAGHTKLR